MKPFLETLVALGILLGATHAQSRPAQSKVLTNSDILMLAKAGFNEEFIINAIESSKSDFDVSANGLSELAREGLNQRIVRVMAGGAPAVALPAPALAPAPYPETMVMAGTEPRVRVQVVHPSRVGLAIAAQVPYYENTSFLFGLFHKKIGVGAIPNVDQIMAPGTGGGATSSHMMANFPTLVSPAGSRTRYVIVP